MSTPMINNSECLSPSTLKERLKSSLCCFHAAQQHNEIFAAAAEDGGRKQATPRSPYAWLKSTAHELEIKDMCRGLIGRKGRNRKRHNSSDFRYDPMSYQLNFEDETSKSSDDEAPLNNFVARLPATPDRFAEESWVQRPPTVTMAR
ncbi:hypothetical protein Tsubulata_051575, partial [Turnera subulata]